MKNKLEFKSRTRQRGMGLVEIMIGVAIGMIGMLAMFAVMSVAEERKRSLSSSSDAQNATAVALFRMERDVTQAGGGFGNAREFYGCDVRISIVGRDPVAFNTPLAPVSIMDGGAGSDTVTIFYGNSSMNTANAHFNAGVGTTKRIDQGTAGYTAATGAVGGDVLLFTDEGPVGATGCGLQTPSLGQVSALTSPTPRDRDLTHGLAGANTYGNFSTPGSGFIYNLGLKPTINLWMVDTINGVIGLKQVDLIEDDTDGIIVAENVINIQAQYGVDTSAVGSPPIIEWMDADDPDVDMTRISAIRVGVLVRSAVLEKLEVTDTNGMHPGHHLPPHPTWAGSGGAHGAFVIPDRFPLPDDTPSANYRYRVFESVMPLRNGVWGRGEN